MEGESGVRTKDDGEGALDKVAFRHAMGLRRDGAHAEAVEAFRAGLEVAPDDGPAWLCLGDYLSEIGEGAEASDAFGRACALCPSWELASVCRFHCLKLLGRGQEAQAEAQRFIDLVKAGAARFSHHDHLDTFALWSVEKDPDALARETIRRRRS